MKKASKLLAMVMVLILMMSLCGCGGGSGKSIVGTWGVEWDMSEMMSQEMGDEFADFESPLVVSLLFDFNEDGTFKMYADEEKFRASIDSWAEDLCDYAVEYMYDVFETEQGLDRETADALVNEQFGMSIEEMMDQQIDLLLNVDAAIESIETTGIYETKGNKLYMSDRGEIDKNQYDNFTVSGDTLTLELPKGAVDTSMAVGLEYPIVLHKVN